MDTCNYRRTSCRPILHTFEEELVLQPDFGKQLPTLNRFVSELPLVGPTLFLTIPSTDKKHRQNPQ
jgi:hypothetical protein